MVAYDSPADLHGRGKLSVQHSRVWGQQFHYCNNESILNKDECLNKWHSLSHLIRIFHDRSPSLRDTGLIIGTDLWNISQSWSQLAQQNDVIWKDVTHLCTTPLWHIGNGGWGQESINCKGEMEGMSQINLALSVFLFLVFLSVLCLCLSLCVTMPLCDCRGILLLTGCYLQKTRMSSQPEHLLRVYTLHRGTDAFWVPRTVATVISVDTAAYLIAYSVIV
jgi:hypothetical protein